MNWTRLGRIFSLVAALALLWAPAAEAASPTPVGAQHGMVVTAHRLASKAGIDVLKSGGNAVDAAVAVGYALAVTFPEAGNLGGGGFMTIRFHDGRTAFIDFREKAPGAATATMYLDANGNPVARAQPPRLSRCGHSRHRLRPRTCAHPLRHQVARHADGERDPSGA